MGLGNFIKRHAGIGKLPDSQLNENTIINILSRGAPFIVALPIFDTVSAGGSTYLSKSMGGGFRQTVRNSPPKRKVQRKKLTYINYNSGQITIQHVQNNGAHIFINTNNIAKVGKLNNGLIIELINGIQYQFLMNNEIKNKWKTLGFKPQSIIDTFYRLIVGGNPTPSQPTNYQNSIPLTFISEEEMEKFQKKKLEDQEQKKLKRKQNELKRALKKDRQRIESNKVKAEYNLEIPCPVCGKMIKDKAVRCKYCKTNLNEYKNTPEYQDEIRKFKKIQDEKLIESKKQKNNMHCPNCDKEIPSNAIRCKHCNFILKKYKTVEKAKNESIRNAGFEEQATIDDMKLNEDKISTDDEKSFNDLFNIGKINQKESHNNPINQDNIIPEAKEENKTPVESEKTNNLNDNISYDIPFKKIKEAKELLDIGAITQEEFDEIKSKYLKDF